MEMSNKICFEVKTDFRSYQFILNTDSPIDEFLNVLEAVHEYYSKIKEEKDSKEKPSEETTTQE